MTAGAEPGGERFRYTGSERFADGRIFSPVCLRNNPPIVARLALILDGRSGPVLEIGAGTGQHAAAFALAFPQLDWFPSDPDPLHRTSIMAWQTALRAPERPALALDAAADWAGTDSVADLGPLTAIFSMNVIHIAPFAVAEGIIRGAASALAPGGLLIFYGPFHENGAATGPGNASFDLSLQSRNREWGIRDISELSDLAGPLGLAGPDVQVMPADNRLVVFSRLP